MLMKVNSLLAVGAPSSDLALIGTLLLPHFCSQSPNYIRIGMVHRRAMGQVRNE